MVGDGATAVYANFTGNSELSAEAAASTQRNLSTIAEASVDLAVDGAAAAIPGVPAGGTKALRALDKAEDAVKVADKVGDVKNAIDKGVKSVKEVARRVNPDKEIKGALKPIRKHIDKVANPTKYYPKWNQRSALQNQRTVNYWLKKELPGLWRNFINAVNKKK